MPTKPLATYSLIGLNVFVFLLTTRLLPANNILAQELPLYFPLYEAYHPWQFISHMFMHGSMSHLFMNMFGLFSFGTVLERVWGMKRFLIFYFVVGLGAGIIYTAVNYFEYQSMSKVLIENGVSQTTIDTMGTTAPETAFYQIVSSTPTLMEQVGEENVNDFFRLFYGAVVGASGAIYGILTAFGLLFPNAKLSLIFLPIPIAAKYFIPVILLLDLFSGLTGFSLFGGGIAHFAHLGGALIGFLLMLFWKKQGTHNGMNIVA